MQKTYHGTLRWALSGAAFALMMAGSPCLSFDAYAAPQASSQTATKTVSSTVYDSEGEPLIGATVMVKGTSIGTATDVDGKFSLSCAPDATLAISYVGFKPKEVKVSALPAKIVLDSDQDVLDEVVVIGYGTTTRKAAVGAVDQVKGDFIKDRPVRNMYLALQGAAPGVIVQNTSYDPNNDGVNFNIRGVSTTNSNTPLYVIDGVVAGGTAFKNLQPDDVESISILKDAGASAIYGSRAANGVILVTTRSGKKGQKSQVTLSANLGLTQPYDIYRPVPGYANAILYNQAKMNAGNNPEYTPDQIVDLYNHRDIEQWQADDVYKTSLQQKYNVQVTGGSDNSTFMFSLGYFDQDSNLRGVNNKGKQRYTMRTNISTDVGRLHMNAILSYTRNDSKKFNTEEGNLYSNTKRMPSYYYYNEYDENGILVTNAKSKHRLPLYLLNSPGYNKKRENDVAATASADFRIIDGLKLRGSLNANIRSSINESRNQPWPYLGVDYEWHMSSDNPKDYRFSSDTNQFWRITSQILLDFNRTFGDHNVIALFGATNESTTSKGLDYWFNYADPVLWKPTDKTDSELGQKGGHNTTTDTSRHSMTSIIGRLGYNYKSRYFAEFNFRYDGSDKFAPKNRWGFFPSLSLSWRPSEEDFMEYYREHIGDLKIRGSWGILGNQDVGDYAYMTRYNLNSIGFMLNDEAVPSAGYNLGNYDITWEKTHSYDFGVDFTFLNGAISTSFDYFYKRTKDILMGPQVPNIYGPTFGNANIGEMSNRGWEFQINYYLTTGDFNHTFSFNIADTRNKLISFPGHYKIDGNGELYRIRQEGLPLNDYYGYKVIGIFQSYDEIESSATPPGYDLQPGDLKFQDVNGDGIIDVNDRVNLGTAYPHYTYGFNYNVEWKGIDLGIFLQGVGQRAQFIRGESLEPYHTDYGLTMYKHQLDFWTPTNTDARWPRIAQTGSASIENNWRLGNSNNILNGAYMRLKNLQLGYNLPKSVMKVLGMQKCRIYVNGENLLTFSKNSFVDPEVTDRNSNGGDGGDNSYRAYPCLRYYGFGLDVTF